MFNKPDGRSLLKNDSVVARERFERVIYIIAGRAPVNDRIDKLLQLSAPGCRVVLVTPEADPADRHNLVVKALPNPTNILRPLKLRTLKRMVDHLLFFPSQKILYVKPVERALRKHIRADIEQGKKVVLLTCVPPHDVALIGLLLKKQLTQIRWILDWQDLWSYDENYFERVPRIYRSRLLKLEHRMLDTADLNITTNGYAKAVLEEHYGIPGERITSIPHHYCASDLADSTLGDRHTESPDNGRKPIRIGFLGTFYKPPRVPGDMVSDVIGELRNSGLSLELHVHGGIPRVENRVLEKMRRNGVVLHRPVSHKESLTALVRYDFLMLMLSNLPNSRAVMSIKLPHYLLAGRPILAIVPDPSAVADIVRETGSGYVIDINGDWRIQLKQIVSESATRRAPPDRNLSAIEQYSWENISRQWMKVLTQE